MKSLWIWFFILCRERGGSNPYLMMSFITRFLWELAVKLWPFMGAFNARSLKHLAVKNVVDYSLGCNSYREISLGTGSKKGTRCPYRKIKIN